MTLHNLKFKLPIAVALSLLIFLLHGCSKNDHNSVTPQGSKGQVILVSGGNQSGIYGQDLADTVVVRIVPAPGQKNSSYSLRVNTLQGNGLIENYTSGTLINAGSAVNGILTFKWRLGCNNPAQKLSIALFADSLVNYGKADDSVIVSASGTKPGGWGRSCGCGVPGYQPKIASFDNHTLYLASNGLFSSIDGGINWTPVSGIPYWSSIMDVQFNSKGWMYVLTAGNGIYYSQDGKNFQAINNGIIDMRNPTAFTVTDDLLFVSFYFDGPYMSNNNGGFWQKFLVGFNSERYYLIKKHPNGQIYMFNDWNNFLVSNDTAKTWQIIPTNGAEVNYQAYDLEIGPDGNVYIGSDDATLTTYSPVSTQFSYKSFYQYNSSDQPTNNISFYNNNVYFLLNDNPAPGIYNTANWSIVNTGFTKTITSYYIRSNGSFLLFSNDGLYYPAN